MEWGIDWLVTMPALLILSILVGLDILGGIIVATVRKELDSSLTYIGMVKKAGIFVVIAVGFCIEMLYANYRELMPFDAPKAAPVAVLFALGFCVHEIISILEKIKRSGAPMPKRVVELLSRLRQSASHEEKDEHKPGIWVGVKVDSDTLETKQSRRLQRREAAEAQKKAEESAAKQEEATANIQEQLTEISAQQHKNSDTIHKIDQNTSL